MEDKIFSVTNQDFEALAIKVFHFQYESNEVYQTWVRTLGIDPHQIQSIREIPFLRSVFSRPTK
jgi:phenylacetate-coenzyme A ligase PaaK-like adenylate-forming protein